jgi:hypothetical protein
MLLFNDIISDDELCSDGYDVYVSPPLLWLERCYADYGSKEVDDVAYEVDCEMIIVKEGDIDIGKLTCSRYLGDTS